MGLYVVMGNSGQSTDILDAVLAAGRPVDGLLWNNPPAAALWGVPVFGGAGIPAGTRSGTVVIALGDPREREQTAEAFVEAGWTVDSVVHPAATVSQRASVGVGVAILAGVNVSPNATIGDYVVLNANCSIDHDCVLESGVQFGPGVTLAGNVRIGARAFLGVGASVMPGIRVGAGALVGAGAVVIRDVEPGARVVGNPARLIG